jgi:hypothetical protein
VFGLLGTPGMPEDLLVCKYIEDDKLLTLMAASSADLRPEVSCLNDANGARINSIMDFICSSFLNFSSAVSLLFRSGG